MVKRYDYHSLYEQYKIAVFIVPSILLVFFIFFATDNHSLIESVFAVVIGLLTMTITILGYMDLKYTFIEINDEGILFHSWNKHIFSLWSEVRKIKAIIRSYKIFTDHGTFYIRRIEPAELSKQPLDIKTDRVAFSHELLTAIKERAPHSEFVNSIFNRPLKL
jgi:hypothetical protein